MSGTVRFALVESSLRSFRHALTALSKIGSEILIEALPSQLVLRAINSSQSAYLSVSYASGFFDAYDIYGGDVVQAGALVKNVAALFKTQRIRLFVFNLNSTEGILEISLSCENGLKKTFVMGCLNAEVLQATVDKAAFPVMLVAETSAFSRMLSTFHSGVDEVTLISQPDSASEDAAIQIRSYADPRKEQGSDLVTQISVDARKAFLHYGNSLAHETSVTFNVRDFRAMVALCESLKACALIRFDGPGHPLIVEPCTDNEGSWDGEFDAELVLATLVSEEVPLEEASQPRPIGSAQRLYSHVDRYHDETGAIVGTPPEEHGWSTGIPGVLTVDRNF